METHQDKAEKMKLWHLESVVKEALETAEDKKRWKEYVEWCAQFESKDPKVVAAAFKKEWNLIKKVVKEKSDLIRLKRKFGIK